MLRVAKNGEHMQQQITEIASIQNPQTILIGTVKLRQNATSHITRLSSIDPVGRKATIFPPLNKSHHKTRRPFFTIDICLFEKLLEQPELIIIVKNGKVRLQSCKFRVPPQHLRRDRMKSTEPPYFIHSTISIHQNRNAIFHFQRSFIGKSNSKNFSRMRPSGG